MFNSHQKALQEIAFMLEELMEDKTITEVTVTWKPNPDIKSFKLWPDIVIKRGQNEQKA